MWWFLRSDGACHHRGMRRFRGALAVGVLAVAAPAVAHDEHVFEPVAEAARWRPAASDRVLFFPLAEEFAVCVPLRDPCPADSSSLMVVRAGSRPVMWQAESAELPEASFSPPPLRAMGDPPPGDFASARYLVPVLDGTGVGLEFLPRRFEGGRLVAAEGAGAASDAARVVPVLVGPVLGGAAPSGQAPSRVLEPPSTVAASELRDLTAALLVRRASPSRVVFGVRAGESGYVPLVDERGVALLARHEGRVGLVVPSESADDSDVAALSREKPGDGDGDSAIVTVGRVVLLVALLAMAVGLWRRRRSSA